MDIAKDMVIRRIAVAEVAGLHPLLAARFASIEMQYLVPDGVLTRDAVLALLKYNPMLAAKLNGRWVALADSRLLAAARAFLDPRIRIPVLDCTGLDSELMEAAIWSRLALHPLYTALHPRVYPVVADSLRNAIPKPLAKRWCPGIASARQFANATGIARNTFRRCGPKQAVTCTQPNGPGPLERIRQRVRHD